MRPSIAAPHSDGVAKILKVADFSLLATSDYGCEQRDKFLGSIERHKKMRTNYVVP